MKKALGVIFAFLACCELVAIYAMVRAVLAARSADADAGTETMPLILGLGIGVPLLVVFSAAAVWCFQRGR